ncbi:hypothetical protein D1007_54814 [Hordeum vulgare]|nr:hypothetical protein D1007_54814 [Hordeum vulgare]
MVVSFQNKDKAPVYPHRPRHRVSVPVHQARWHWDHRIPLSYPDVTLLHHRHLDPERIPVPAVSLSARMHTQEMSRRRRQLTPEQRLNPMYAADSPNWEVWFALEHEEQHRHGVLDVQLRGPLPPPLVGSDEGEETKAAYEATLASVLRESEEEEQCRVDEEEATYEVHACLFMDWVNIGCIRRP